MKRCALIFLLLAASNLVAEQWQPLPWNSTGSQSLRQQQHYLRQRQYSKQPDQRKLQKKQRQEQKKWSRRCFYSKQKPTAH